MTCPEHSAKHGLTIPIFTNLNGSKALFIHITNILQYDKREDRSKNLMELFTGSLRVKMSGSRILLIVIRTDETSPLKASSINNEPKHFCNLEVF